MYHFMNMGRSVADKEKFIVINLRYLVAIYPTVGSRDAGRAEPIYRFTVGVGAKVSSYDVFESELSPEARKLIDNGLDGAAPWGEQ